MTERKAAPPRRIAALVSVVSVVSAVLCMILGALSNLAILIALAINHALGVSPSAKAVHMSGSTIHQLFQVAIEEGDVIEEGPVEERLADRFDAEDRPRRHRMAEALRQAGAADRAVYAAIASTPMPALDEPLRRLSEAANYSRLWLGIAGVIAVFGGRRGRRAAARGVVAIGATSAAVNLGVKSLYERPRPDRATAGVPETRRVPMPSSTSFPSGHSASGFAFATAVGSELPALAFPLQFLAGAVAYSRVHTGVHYPGDAVVGAIVGAGTGQVTWAILSRARRPT